MTLAYNHISFDAFDEELTQPHFRISYAYSNQKRLDVECKKLENNCINLSKNAEKWCSMVGSCQLLLAVYT